MAKPIYPDAGDVQRSALTLEIRFDDAGEPEVFALVVVTPTNRPEPALTANRQINLSAGEADALKGFADGLLVNIGAVLDI